MAVVVVEGCAALVALVVILSGEVAGCRDDWRSASPASAQPVSSKPIDTARTRVVAVPKEPTHLSFPWTRRTGDVRVTVRLRKSAPG